MKFLRSVSSTYHLQFNLDTKTPLLHCSDPCGERLPHAGGSSQGELRAALQSGDGAR